MRDSKVPNYGCRSPSRRPRTILELGPPIRLPPQAGFTARTSAPAERDRGLAHPLDLQAVAVPVVGETDLAEGGGRCCGRHDLGDVQGDILAVAVADKGAQGHHPIVVILGIGVREGPSPEYAEDRQALDDPDLGAVTIIMP